MKTVSLNGWWKYFIGLGLVIGFALAGNISCARVLPLQKATCTNSSYVRKQFTPRDVPCKTKCGLRLYGSDDCRGLQEAEDKAVEVYNQHFASVCEKFENWIVVVQPKGFEETGWNSSAHDGGVVGLTFCKQQEMQIETDDWQKSSLTHEIMHLLEWCDSAQPASGDPHAGWDGGWQVEAIKKAGGP